MSLEQQTMQVAVEWYVCLNDPDVTPAEQDAFSRWLAQSDLNRLAWEKLQQVEQPFTGLNANLAQAVFFEKEVLNASRRASMKKLVALLLVGTGGTFIYREQPWQTMLADYTTAKGERREITLPDQTVIVLNSDSALNVHINNGERAIHLVKGEVMIETGHPAGVYLPFKVHTRYGMLTALGTQFSVRDHADAITLNVFNHAVKVQPVFDPTSAIFLHAGQTVQIHSQAVSAITVLAPGSDLWTKGILSINDMPLGDFLTELERYHGGFIRCDETIAKLPISGAFPIAQLPEILNSLEQTYHLRTVKLTRFWTQLKPIS